jgi:type I restriction enzyme S subunit
MNATELLAMYERVADAPDAVGKLRRLVLDLALRGKLVAQNATDGCASELLTQIAAERAQLERSKRVRASKSVAVSDDAPFEIPSQWRWSFLAEVGVISPRNVADDGANASFVPMTLISSEYGVVNDHVVRPWRDIKTGYSHFAEGDVGLAKITPCFENGKSTVFQNLTGGLGSGTTELHIVRPILVLPRYVLVFLKSPYFVEGGIPKMTGTAGQKRVPLDYFAGASFPLPPLAEQHRIIAKVDELMSLCDQLAAARTEREAARDRLAAASLARLNAPDADTFQSDAHFALNVLPALSARPDQVKQLRQTILNLAVHGRLIPQDLEQGSTGQSPLALPSQSATGRARSLGAEGTHDTPVGPQLPDNWELATLSALSRKIQYGYTASADVSLTDVRMLRITDIQDASVDWERVPGCVIAADEVAKYRLEPNDILIARTGGTIGKSFLIESVKVVAVFASYLIRVQPLQGVFARYLKVFLGSPLYWEQLSAGTRGTGQPNVNGQTLGCLLVPLPPLAEQFRIVAKVDELMALCDKLEASLKVGESSRSRLLEALLHEALEPVANVAA